jgi:hypothetical protein
MSLERHLNFLYYKRNFTLYSLVFEEFVCFCTGSEEDKLDSKFDNDISEAYDADVASRSRDFK